MATVPPKNPSKTRPGSGKASKPGAKATPPSGPPPAPEQGSWVYTVGFALAVVSFVIGVYQTMVERDLASNYWLFMISLGFLFGVRWFRLRQTRK
ncbi:MAG: hypothetical protein H7330_15710 [Hymenobacteraceae bacterium]|nr:hypothetical protein [Hymenobacteraceae bacterium]